MRLWSSYLLVLLCAAAYISDADDDIELVESELMEMLYGSRMHGKWISVTVRGESWPIHYIESVSYNHSYKDLVLLHGYGATR